MEMLLSLMPMRMKLLHGIQSMSAKESLEMLLKTPSHVCPELVVEYVQANLSLHGQSQTQIVANSVSAAASVDNVVINILEESDSETVTPADPWRLSTRLPIF